MQMQIFDTMTGEYLQATQNWFSQVETAGMILMVILLVIQLTLKLSKSIMTGEGNAMTMMVHSIKNIVLLSVLYYLMINAGTLLPELFNSFSQLGVAGSTITKLDPSSVVSEGLAIASAILQSFNGWGVLTDIAFSFFGVFCCIAVVVCYGLIAAELMITLIESYFLVAVSALFIAFGASSYTLPMAREYIGMTVAVGIKLMMLYVMIAIGVQLGSDWAQLINQATQAKDWSTYLGVAVGSIIYYLIVKSVPSKIASAASHSFAISHMDNITGATTGSVAKTAAGVLMGVGAFEMAGAAMRAAGGSANGLHGKMASFAGQGSSGLDGAAGGVQGNQSASLASGMLTHFGSSHSGGVSDISPSGGRSGGSLITPSVIHLPGPEPANRKGQIDLFAASN